MPIEQQLATLGEQLSNLTKAITLVTEKINGTQTQVEKPTKSKKATVVDQTPEPAATEFKEVAGYLLEGDPAGTRYFVVEARNTAYKQRPGDPDCTLAGATIVPGKVYLEKKAEFEKKFKLAQAIPTSVAVAIQEPATTVPTATAQAEVVSMPVKFEAVIDAMRGLHKEQGNEGVQKILTKHGVDRIPKLNGVVPNETLLAEIEAVKMGI